MHHPLLAYWPLALATGVPLVAAEFTRRIGVIPNYITYSAAAAGWLAAGLLGAAHALPTGGGIGSSLLCSLAALALLLPAYARFSFGAGCVKTQAAAAAWIGCGLSLWPALALTAAATLSGLALMFLTGYVVTTFVPHNSQRNRLMDAQLPMTVTWCLTIVVALVLGWV